MKGERGKVIGERLKTLRGERTQSDVANAVGVTIMAISQYERGKRIPSDEMKLSLAKYFNTTVEKLFFAQV